MNRTHSDPTDRFGRWSRFSARLLLLTMIVLRVSPALAPYEVGLFTLEKKLRSPLIAAFWAPALLDVPR